MGKDVKTASSATPLRDWLRLTAARLPDAPALDGPEGIVGYAPLLQAVQALTARLAASGFVPGDRIGIAATRSNDSVIAILAAVEAGLGYVPLDLAYPPDRLQMMLADAQVRSVLGSAEALATLGAAVGAFPTIDAPAATAKPPHGAAADLLYVLFTSGSTGRPKGVAMGQQPLANLVAWHAAHPRLSQAARTLQFAPLSFDVHCQEIFSAMATGSTLVILPDADRRDPARLHAALQQKCVERVFLPYVALQMIAEAARDEAPRALRDVISAGEQLQVTPAIRSLFQRLPGAELHNHYGPTETHVVTAHELRGNPAAWPDIPPIGLPLPYVQAALREEDGSGPTSAAQGELLLGGATLAHGYLGRPELTAERFLESPPGFPGRWYATGDLVRRDTDGTLTYLGRIDQQLKVDGFRIEPGEIELALMDHPAVQDAVVAAPDVPGAGRQLVAYLVLRDAGADHAATFSALRAHLRGRVPEYMVPVRYLPLDRLPTTPSGKIDRRALPIPSAAALPQASDPRALVRAVWAELLGLPDLGEQQNLFDLGARSLLVLRFVARLRDAGITGISVADVYDRPTVAGLVSLATGGGDAPKRQARRAETRSGASAGGGVAIVGMAVRTAGASDVDTLWTRLLEGYEGLRRFAPHEIDPSVPQELRERPNFVAARGVLENAGRFDAAFFGISAREATLLDPQQRQLLELSWNALEDAGIDPAHTDQRIGVYAGTANNTYLPALRDEQPDLIRQSGEFAAMLASEKDYAATRVANRLDLRGPAVSIHTACSTGLVAVANAWHALDSGQCDVVVAGGATVIVPQEGGYLHVEGGMESADGRCRPFDAEASGTVFGSAGAVIAMKRLEDALADGDTIYAVMRGVGLNNDGADKASFTAPSVSGQAGAIRAALERAGVSARSIGYVEAHGTGTVLGDPIEVAALTRAWREDTADTQFCTLGSLKGNFGHTVAAAGVLGVIKSALALQREVIPGTLHFQKPNPHIDFTATPFRVTGANLPWPRSDEPRRAAVSSFGVGGTNAHVVLEEAPLPRKAPLEPAQRWVLPLSARTADGTQARARELAAHLQAHPELPLAEVAATLMRGRKPMAQRLAVVARDTAEAVTALGLARGATAALDHPRLVYLFPGQGSQHPGMARGLHAEVPAFREALERCLTLLEKLLPKAAFRHWLLDADPKDADAGAALANTLHAQPALFSMSFALCAWLDSLGLQPDAMIGHSIGEYAAACRAGVFSVDDALAAVVARAQAMAAQAPGSMLAVRASREVVAPYLVDGIEIAGVNAPHLTVVAGSHAAIDALAQRLDGTPVEGTRLKVSHAFHSAIMDGALPAVAAGVARARLAGPAITTYSCVSGQPLTAAEATDPQYWARQVRATVQFSPAVVAELARGEAVFVEVGPSQALTALLRQHRTAQDKAPRVVPLLGAASQPGEPPQQAMAALGALWCAGVDIAWPVAASARRCHLPGYPFAGDTHWFKRRTGAAAIAAGSTALAPAATLTELPSTEHAVPLPVPVPPMSRLPRIEQELTRILSDVSGVPAEEMDAGATLVDQGLDSLSLTQATLELERVFGVKVRLRRLMEDLDTIGKLVTFFDGEMPPEKFAPPPAAAPSAVQAAQTAAPAAFAAASAPMALAPANGGLLQQVIQQQMQLMTQQLALLAGQPAMLAAPAVLAPPVAPVTGATPAVAAAPAAADPAQPDKKALIDKPFGAAARITLERKSEFTPAQRQWVGDFIQRYVARSGSSKQMSQKYRKVMADPRVVTGFNPLWKDLVYPIVADRSKGARVWDIDGNEYIDLLSCFGANLLGYQPDALLDAMVKQLHAGIEVGPQHPMAGEVAELIAEFTGMDRVAFCNTGSEAVMGAMRIARTVTGRKTIAIFTNSYHGIFDEVIVRGTKQLRSLSAAPGILANAVENVLVLDWNSEDSLRILRERGHELAAIMTEPVQNKYPTIQPREFVQSLRKIADDAGCALIFDEVVTGFRLAPGGAQEFYGVRADIATYGKIIGGGLPFAAIAGGTQWLDALDGGHWQYGDDSYPEAGVTYFAGTFVRHPLALAAAKASLLHLKAGGRALYDRLNGRTQALIDRLNAAFAVRGAPVRAVHCASLWRLQWDDDQKYVSLFYYLSRFHGLHLYEQFGHFVTEAMGEAETDRIFQVFTNALDELMALGFITPRPGSPGGLPKSPAVTPVEARAPAPAAAALAPLTPGQTERWLAANFDAAARRALNETLCLTLRGPVDVEQLQAAAQSVVRRHDAFRLRFSEDEPLQGVDASYLPGVSVIDLRSRGDAAAALEAYCTNASARDFELARAPLAEVSLLRLADDHVVVHLVASHLVFDGWASGVFVEELGEAFAAAREGRAARLAPAGSPLEFGAAEAARWEGADARASRDYWKSTLRSPPPPPTLGDRTPPAQRTYGGDTLHLRIEGRHYEAIRDLARKHKATPFQCLMACVASLVAERTRMQDFVLCVPYASQALSAQPPLLADGVLDLPIRVTVGKDSAPAALLPLVKTRLMDALENPHATQGTLARDLGLPPSGSRPPLTGVYFNLNPRLDLGHFAPLTASAAEARKTGLLSELIFNFYEEPSAFTLDLHHSTEFFSPARIREVADHLLAVIDHITPGTAHPAAPAAKPCPEADAARIARWNATTRRYPVGLRLGDLVQRAMAAHPGHAAVRFEGETVTYAELDRRAWALAAELRARGVKPGTLVGVCLERSVELVVALLGVIYSGGAYVPLDPSYPALRLTQMDEDAKFRIVVTRQQEWSRCRPAFRADVDHIALDTDVLHDAPAAARQPCGTPADLAYVIFTSGSTGRPKGAMNAHAGIVNRLLWMQDEYALTANDRVLQKTPYSFDVSVWEFFWPLMTGATIVVARPEGHRDAEYLTTLIRTEQVSVLHFVPSMLRLFLEEPAVAECTSLRQVVCSGEALPIDLVDGLLARLPAVALANLYGPTEAAVDVTYWNCRAGDPRRIVPIGHPVANTQMYVLDDDLRQVPVGKEGELYIGGVQVGQGYVARPDLTAQRFFANPFVPGGRMYRTGDVGRWLDDGSIEYLGRADDQVKLRGNRIELGEIESVLQAHAAVARAVVVAREFSPGDTRLVAYIVPRAGDLPTAALKEHLAARLPEYMIPQHFMAIMQVPLLPNGKTDRKSLPSPTPAKPTPRAAASPAPVSTLQGVALVDAIAAEMAKALGVASVGADDNFFELGGHSLLVARLSTRLGEVLGQRPGLRPIFEAPTPRRLAALLGSASGADTHSLPEIPARSDQSYAPMSLQQQRLWFVERLTPGTRVHHIPSSHRLYGEMDVAAFTRAVEAFVARQPSLRTVFEPTDDGDARQHVLDSLPGFTLPFADLSALGEQEREAAWLERLMEMIDRPFDLERGPLFRTVLLKITETEHRFIFVTHHLIWDGWSFDLLYSNVGGLYDAFRRGTSPALPPITVTYGDYAAWQRDWMTGPELARQTNHWRSVLLPLPEPLALPEDRARPPVTTGDGASHHATLTTEIAARLHEVARSNGTTLYVTLLAAYTLLLHGATGQDDVCVGTPVRGRDQPGTEPLIGFFVNMLPLRSTKKSEATFADWLATTRQMVTSAFACPDVPFEQLVRELGVPRDTSRSPLYQALFSFQDVRDRNRSWGNLEHRRTRIPLHNAAQDISLWCVETPAMLECAFTYDSNIFVPSSIATLAERFVALVERIAAQPTSRLDELLLPPDAEVRQVAAWNATTAALPAPSVAHWVALARGGTEPALVAGDRRLSCADLETRSNRLAHALVARGARPGNLVGIHLERSPEMLVALLGVLKSGAGYVPLDPGFPLARLQHMVEDAGLALLITSSGLAGTLAVPADRTLCLDDADTALAGQPSTAPQVNVAAADPAYVIYTSGSTGKPKGVAVPHRAVANFLASMARRPGLGTNDTLLAVTTLSFDIAVLELMLPLRTGAKVVLASQAEAMDGRALSRLIGEHGVTVMQATPSTWRLLLAAGWEAPPGFRALVGGEPVPRDLVRALCAQGVAVWNMYGPTETTVWSTCGQLTADDETVHIGTPIDNTTVSIRTAQGQSCPVGVAGELCIGGLGVALGYFGKPELTAERFVPDPDPAAPQGALLYRTGDRARWRADGKLEHLGRMDSQVKLRGYRIEPGEIEAVLATHPEVRQAAVIVREDTPGAARLVGYVVRKPGARQPDNESLRTHLRASVPDYMVPQAFVALDALPLTPNGKVDRRALPAPASDAPAQSATMLELPATPTERQLAEIWGDLLGTRAIGRRDRFLEIGGHSLLAMQAQARMGKVTGKDVEVRRFLFDTLAEIAAAYADAAPAAERKPGLLKRLFGRG